MYCPQCGSRLAQDASRCAACGAPTPQASASAPEPQPDLHVALAEANLLRLRGDYDGAMAKCVEVLRREPNDPSAHSLLGDIYQDQGAYSEALSWYKLALQLNPSSAPDRRKVAELESRLAAPREERRGTLSPWRRLTQMGARLPLGLVLGVVLGCIVSAALIALSMSKDTARPGMMGAVRMPRVIAPGAAPAETGRTAAARRVPRPRAQAAAVERPDEPPVIYTPGRGPQAQETASPANRQKALLEALRADAAAEGLMVTVKSVTIDPGDGKATLEVSAQDVVASPEAQPLVLQKCLRLAELAGEHDRGLTYLRLHCWAPVMNDNNVQHEEVVFVGDITTAALRQAAGRDLTLEQALALFVSPPLWHPSMGQPR